tara:strand:+ start:6430 stop:6618 length:189 start_codon:yes stop_codon:yes gene_type:complete
MSQSEFYAMADAAFEALDDGGSLKQAREGAEARAVAGRYDYEPGDVDAAVQDAIDEMRRERT